MNARIPIHRARLVDFCRRWRIVEIALFGSVLRDNFRPDSDVDVLVSFDPSARWSSAERAIMEDELRTIFGREVDIVERKALEASDNYIRRRHILQSLERVHMA